MENILIVAENEELGEILANYLNSNNFNAHAASCLEDAQERLRETQYGLVIADLPSMKIPDLELCQRLRSVEQNLPMLFMCDIEGNFFTGFHLQFVEYIIKPFRKDEFNRKIRALMGDSIKKQIVVSA